MEEQKVKGGFGTASLVLGIISLVICGIPLGILAVIFGAIGINKNQKYSLAGLILGLIGFASAVLLTIFFISLFA